MTKLTSRGLQSFLNCGGKPRDRDRGGGFSLAAR